MILGVDHVALSCAVIDRAAALLAERGYAIQFLEKGLHNAPEKTPMLRRYEPTHAIAYAQAKQGIAIELTSHGKLEGSGSAYKVLFHGDRPTSVTPPDDASAVQLDDLQTPAWFEGAGPWRVHRLSVDVLDEDKSLAFWTKGLGARMATAEASQPCVAFVSPMARWSLTLRLNRVERVERGMLDDSGFPCLALLTTNLEQDRNRACEHGGHSATTPFVLTVNGRPLKVALLRGPADELVELIEIQRNS